MTLWLVRHGETAWSRTGNHTGTSDIALTETGRADAIQVGRALANHAFTTVLSSPLSRALETCRLAGFSDAAQIDPDLCEWNYGAYEGRTTAEIRTERPGWNLWTDGAPGGESAHEVAARAKRIIERAADCTGDVLLFSHGHFLRVLAATWIGLPPEDGRLLKVDTSSIGRLGWERETRVIEEWNRGGTAQQY